MTDKELVERYKMALQAIAVAAGAGMPNSAIITMVKTALTGV